MLRSFGLQNKISIGLLLMLALLIGCGGGSQVTPPPVNAGATSVMVVLTSTANDKLTEFDMALTTLSLNDSAGNSVSVFSKPPVQIGSTQLTDFMRLNGAAQPLGAATVPQGTYTSATVKVAACQFGFASPASGATLVANNAEGLCGQGTGNTTVTLPSPITISGQNIVLALNLEIPQSYTVTGNTYTISPVFSLAPITISASPTNVNNGKIAGVAVRMESINTGNNSFTAQTADGTLLTMNTSSNTQFQGIGGLAAITTGMLVSLDGAIQTDGTLLATRLEVNSPTAVTEDLMIPLAPASPVGTTISQPMECFPGPADIPVCNSLFFISNTVSFHVSGQMSNLQSLPFAPLFDSSNFVLGQNVSVAASTTVLSPGGMQASDITLQPQTFNGIVTAVSTTGNFNVYTVSIASYHPIPVTQQETGLSLSTFVSVPNPTTVTVYADASTQLLQSGAIAPGSLLRFRGLLFNDTGALRLDCQEILDGVAE
jgi:hypothetical protein